MKPATVIQSLFSLVLLLAFATVPHPAVSAEEELDVPYVPTPEIVVQKMLNMADVKPTDYVIDLGSGDGRINIAAAQRDATGHGIDLNPERVKEARANAAKAGVKDKVVFKQGDIFKSDFSQASVITMYLMSSVNLKLRPTLLNQLEPGTRVVSHDFGMGEWSPDKEVTLRDPSLNGPHAVYLWIVPANVEGNWKWSHNGNEFTLALDQRFQEIEASLNRTDTSQVEYNVTEANLRGERVEIRASSDDGEYVFNGRKKNSTIRGTVQSHPDGGPSKTSTWHATRTE